MLNNIVYLLSYASGSTVRTAVTQIPGQNGKSVRISSDRSTQLSVSQGESNENKGLVTLRTNARVQGLIQIPDSDLVVRPYVQLTWSVPVDPAVTNAIIQKMTNQLIHFSAYAEASNSADAVIQDADIVGVPRLLIGEG